MCQVVGTEKNLVPVLKRISNLLRKGMKVKES